MIKQLLGKRIKEIRKSKNMTQEKLAEHINVETSSISNIENGRYFPTAENLDKIIQVLDISPSDLFCAEYNGNTQLLVDEMVGAMSKNENLARLMYKFYMAIKYN